MKIAITTDHAGFESLKQLKVYLESLGHECLDYGPHSLDMDDDYPHYMFMAAKAVRTGYCERGIIMGGSGQGEAMAANRLTGIRCALFYGPVVAKTAVDAEGHFNDDPYEIVKLSREHNDANMLSLSGRFLDVEQMKEAVRIWLDTPFSGIARHERRIKELDTLE